MPDSEDISIVRGRKYFDKPFYNNILSTNIALYKYLANLLFDGDMSRIVWASTDMMFRKRQEQLAARKTYNAPGTDLGLLDLPFCSFRLNQDGVQGGSQRLWWNPALHVEGMWFEELGRRLRITPATLSYEACFCCNHDADLFMIQQANIWEKNAETIIESFVDAIDDNNKAHTLKNIVVYEVTPKMNTSFSEKDWLEKNKIQTVILDITCQTWLIAEDPYHRYAITKEVALDFLHGSNYYHSITEETEVDSGEMIWSIFMEDNNASTLIEEPSESP